MAISMPGSDRDDEEGILAEINTTPLTDVFLVLLIIFMITGSALVESGGRVNLPEAVATQPEATGTTVTLTSNHEIFVDQMKVDEASFGEVLREALDASSTKRVILRGDRDVALGQAVKVMSMIKQAGASEIAIAAGRAPAGSGRPPSGNRDHD